MIVIERTPLKSFRAIRKRELTRFIASVAEDIGLAGEFSVLLAGDERIRELNQRFRGKDRSTDVLSFPAAPDFAGHGQGGDLAISLETAARQAAECGHPLEIEVKVLLLHGLLHLAGYDHETDSGAMARKEIRLRKKLALPLGLIEREHPAEKSRTGGRAVAPRPPAPSRDRPRKPR
jgi:probable rRNA maturation factor